MTLIKAQAIILEILHLHFLSVLYNVLDTLSVSDLTCNMKICTQNTLLSMLKFKSVKANASEVETQI